MKISHLTSSTFCALILFSSHKTHSIDPITGTLAAAAIGAVISGAGYYLYDHTHYSSYQNCNDALDNLYRQLHSEDALIRACHRNSLQELYPLYKKIADEEYQRGNSSNIHCLTQKITTRAHNIIKKLRDEQKRIERYTHYNDYHNISRINACNNALQTLEDFYRRIDSLRIERPDFFSTLTTQLYNDMHEELSQAILCKNSPSYAAFPLHAYVDTIQNLVEKYRRFLQDNFINNDNSSAILELAEHTIQTTTRSIAFENETYKIEIEQLKNEIATIKALLSAQRHKNAELRKINDSLEVKNKQLSTQIKRIQGKY